MVKITSREESQFVYDLARAEAPSYKYMWIGLRRSSPQEDFHWVDNSTVAYQIWAAGEPNNRYNNGEICVLMYISKFKRLGPWNDEMCVNPRKLPMAYMCEGASSLERDDELDIDESGSGVILEDERLCPQGWSTYKGSCYKSNAPTQSWNKAQQACQVLHAHLVVISSREENQFVFELARAQAPRYKYMWIGLHRFSPHERFLWVDNSTALVYHNWAKSEPNNEYNNGENCAHMYISPSERNAKEWNDEICANPSNGGPMLSMCERDGLVEESSGKEEDDESGSGIFYEERESSLSADHIMYGY